MIGNYVLFVEAKGSSVRELVYNLYANSYVSEDRSVLSAHLFAGTRSCRGPGRRARTRCCAGARGRHRAVAHLPEGADIYAWAAHTLQGTCIAVTVVSEPVLGGLEDVAYFVVQDTNGTNGVVRMKTHLLGPSNSDARYAWCVDRGVQYVGSPVSAIGQLSHLAGADGDRPGGRGAFTAVVTAAGAVALPAPLTAASVITVGQGFTSVLQTLPLDSPRSPLVGTRKRIARVRIPVANTGGLTLTVLPGDTPLPFVGQVGDDPNDASDPINRRCWSPGCRSWWHRRGGTGTGRCADRERAAAGEHLGGGVQYEVGM